MQFREKSKKFEERGLEKLNPSSFKIQPLQLFFQTKETICLI